MAVGLVTGNLEPIAWGKMQALGLLEAFSEPHFGGFGSDYCSGAQPPPLFLVTHRHLVLLQLRFSQACPSLWGRTS